MPDPGCPEMNRISTYIAVHTDKRYIAIFTKHRIGNLLIIQFAMTSVGKIAHPLLQITVNLAKAFGAVDKREIPPAPGKFVVFAAGAVELELEFPYHRADGPLGRRVFGHFPSVQLARGPGDFAFHFLHGRIGETDVSPVAGKSQKLPFLAGTGDSGLPFVER